MDQLLQRLTALETLGTVARDQNEEILARLEQQSMREQARDRTAAVQEERQRMQEIRIIALENTVAKHNDLINVGTGVYKTSSIVATLITIAVSGLWTIITWLLSKGH